MKKNAEIILDAINKSNDHMTADELYMNLVKSGNRVSMATVYNNLNKLCADGMVRRLTIEGHSDRFDKTKKHDHLVCKKCGKIADFCFSDLTKLLEKELGDEILSYDLKADYICKDCKKKK